MCTKPSLNLSRDRARMSAARSCLFAFSPQISRAGAIPATAPSVASSTPVQTSRAPKETT